MLRAKAFEGSTPSFGTIHLIMAKAKLPQKIFEWTPELAYVVGLLTTDGNLSKDGRHINMRSSDKDLIRTFQFCLQLKNKISKSYNNGFNQKASYLIQFGNVQFYNWLMTIGLTPLKTYTIGAIKVPDIFFRDFLRGHFDGDGTIFTYKDRYNNYRGRIYTNTRIFTKFVSASKTHITWLYGKIGEIANINGALICNMPTRPNRVPMWEIKFAKKESLKLLQWLYYQPKLPCLKRKMILAKQFLKTIPKEIRRKYTFIKKTTR